MLEDHCMKSVQMQSFFWSAFSRIRAKYGDLLRKSPYSVRMREKMDQKISVFKHLSHSGRNTDKNISLTTFRRRSIENEI